MTERPVTRFATIAVFLLLGAGGCASTSEVVEKRGGPDSTGLALLDCRFTFEFSRDIRAYDQYFQIGMRHYESAQTAQNASIYATDDPAHPIPARPMRGLLLLGPLRPGAYVLERVGMERIFLESTSREGVQMVQEPVTCRPGQAGTTRVVFVVEPGRVVYIGQLQAKGFLASPELESGFVPPDQSAPAQKTVVRARLVADDRAWRIDWDREIGNEIRAWENALAALRETPWSGPIGERLEFLKQASP
ncbi:MAG TPA: hypothetical protein VFS09_07500 [Candidatus Eisenbacteria bacterium]|nr:hypothetical protein [Candidatus Eisenbacteria bacterium]